jgi:hypothetical protein
MTLTEVAQLQRQLERDVAEIIKRFQVKTNSEVVQVHLDSGDDPAISFCVDVTPNNCI